MAGTNLKLKLTPEFYLHLIFLVAALTVIVLSFTMTLIGPSLVYLPGSAVPLPESCTARLLFGIDCPGCGLTRAFISISNGEFANAWKFNPASFVVYLFVVVQLPWQSFQLSRILRGRPCVEEIWIYILPALVAILLLTQWLVRLLF